MNFLLTKEQKDVVMAAKEFAQGEFPDRAQEFDRTETFDLSLWKKASDLGFVVCSFRRNTGDPVSGSSNSAWSRGILGPWTRMRPGHPFNHFRLGIDHTLWH